MLRKQPNSINHTNLQGETIDFSQDKVKISLMDCLDALAKERRFHNRVDWTVLLHSIVVGVTAQRLYPSNAPLIQKAFCHDFQESVVRDVPTPIKRAVGPAWDNVEQMIQEKIFAALKIPTKISPQDDALIHEIDKAVGYIEADAFFADDTEIVESLRNDVSGINQTVIVRASQVFMEVMTTAENYATPEGDVTDATVSMFRQVLALGVD